MPKEQGGFVRGRSCRKQVLSLTTHIENGFQNNLKSGTAFLNLTSAYDTVEKWPTSKISESLKCKTTIISLERILYNRNFKVHFNSEIGKKKVIQNGLPQGSVLSPFLINVYTTDIINTSSRKFTYAGKFTY